MANLDKDALHQTWMHSREEDTDTEMVFRPEGYNFPRSRGRTGFTLKPHGMLSEIGIAPTDAQSTTEGRWELEDGDKLVFYQGDKDIPSRVMQVASADKDRLVVKK
ncbi:MAG TPA: hypothetical protein VGC91_07145 [Pyrinomonadaceae bacterium]|jgi:hypothetical protein